MVSFMIEIPGQISCVSSACTATVLVLLDPCAAFCDVIGPLGFALGLYIFACVYTNNFTVNIYLFRSF